MVEIPMDDCMHCGEAYPLPPNGAMQLYVRDWPVAFFQAVCPHCAGMTRIHLDLDGVSNFIDKVQVRIYVEASPEVRKSWYSFMGKPDPSVEVPKPREAPELTVEPTDRQLKDLFRTLDAFEHGVDG